jgi:hypothetical protein
MRRYPRLAVGRYRLPRKCRLKSTAPIPTITIRSLPHRRVSHRSLKKGPGCPGPFFVCGWQGLPLGPGSRDALRARGPGWRLARDTGCRDRACSGHPYAAAARFRRSWLWIAGMNPAMTPRVGCRLVAIRMNGSCAGSRVSRCALRTRPGMAPMGYSFRGDFRCLARACPGASIDLQ